MLRLCRWQETVHELYRTCRELGGAGQIQHVGESGGGLAIGAGAVWSGTVNVFGCSAEDRHVLAVHRSVAWVQDADIEPFAAVEQV